MVKYLLYLICFLPFFLIASEFSASVNRNQLFAGENLTLSLTLKDENATATPSLDQLKQVFHILSQSQSTSTTIVNGKFSTNTTWQLTIKPIKQENAVTIPAISIETTKGTLSTEPLEIKVSKERPQHSNVSEIDELLLTSTISKQNPYKNEPIFYSIQLMSPHDLSNIGMQPLSVEDSLVEMNGKPTVTTKIVNGISMHVIDVSYLITPLKNGPVRIPSVSIQGGIRVASKQQRRSAFDDEFGSFLRFPNFVQMEPFYLATEETTLDVQPAVAGIVPWLPAQKFEVEDTLQEESPFRVGEPITRTFAIYAEGILSSQIPSLQSLQINDQDFKIYADKPELNDEVKNGVVHSYRKEQYTLIPQKEGLLTLPDMSIFWWDTIKNEKAVTHIPSSTLEILPALPGALLDNETKTANTLPNSSHSTESNTLLYIIIAGLLVLLTGACFWIMTLYRKISNLLNPENLKNKSLEKKKDMLSKSVVEKPLPKKDKNEKLPDLNPT